jgi:DNA-directed RNA polymerase beta subunit
MGIFENLFACICNNNENDDIDMLSKRIDRIESKIELMERDNISAIKRLEDQMNIKFDMLNNKIDNLIIMINKL